jgi:hypothetical protein
LISHLTLRAYTAYVKFFEAEVTAKGIDGVVTEYVFSPEANAATGKGIDPEMINRLLDGIFHPMIYLGCGVEFNMPGVVAEGQSNTQAPQCWRNLTCRSASF